MTSGDLRSDWALRIGPEAADLLMQSFRFGRYGTYLAFVLIVSGTWAQLAGFRFGIVASVVVFIAMIYFFVISLRFVSKTAKAAEAHLRFPHDVAKYVPLRFTSTFDKWYAKHQCVDSPERGL